MSQEENSDSFRSSAANNKPVPTSLQIPQIAGMIVLDAARKYAEAGWYVLPLAPGDKNPGSVVGKGWNEKSSRDAGIISEWFSGHPERGVALHVGRSGAVAFDLDKDQLPEAFAADLQVGAFQHTRTVGARGHYVFAVEPGESFTNGSGEFGEFGEVRGQNGVIVAAPTQHQKADDGGCYRWARVGAVPPLTGVLRRCLRAARSERASEPATSEELEAFLDSFTSADRPSAQRGPIAQFEAEARGWVDGEEVEGESRHDLAFKVLCWGFREAFAGLYPAREFFEAAQVAFLSRFDLGGADAGRDDPEAEFYRAARYAAAEALASDPEETRVKVERDDRGPESPAERFPMLSAADLAVPVPPLEWLIRGVWPKNSFGPMAAASKSLKSYLLLAMAVSVASGKTFLDHFPVEDPGPVLLYVGEGGRQVLASRLQAIAARADVDLESLPIYAVDTIASLDDEAFREQLDHRIEELLPSLVAIDPLYAFHPPGIDPSNLYERGRMLSSMSGLVAERCALIVVDHFNKSTANDLELNSIAQTGMSQWADSWALMKHAAGSARGTGGQFTLTVAFGSRRASGSGLWEVEWKVPMEEDEYGVHVPTSGSAVGAGMDWAVRRAGAVASEPQKGTPQPEDNARRAAAKAVAEDEWALTRSNLVREIGGKKRRAEEAIDQLLADGGLVAEERERVEGSRTVKRSVFGLGPVGRTIAEGKLRWTEKSAEAGGESGPVNGTVPKGEAGGPPVEETADEPDDETDDEPESTVEPRGTRTPAGPGSSDRSGTRTRERV